MILTGLKGKFQYRREQYVLKKIIKNYLVLGLYLMVKILTTSSPLSGSQGPQGYAVPRGHISCWDGVCNVSLFHVSPGDV